MAGIHDHKHSTYTPAEREPSPTYAHPTALQQLTNVQLLINTQSKNTNLIPEPPPLQLALIYIYSFGTKRRAAIKKSHTSIHLMEPRE